MSKLYDYTFKQTENAFDICAEQDFNPDVVRLALAETGVNGIKDGVKISTIAFAAGIIMFIASRFIKKSVNEEEEL